MISKGRSVKLYLVDGNPAGILTVEIVNWTGKVLVAPRSSIGDALKRDEASRTGVYFLVGKDPDQPSKNRVYIGEGDSVGVRIASHTKDPDKDFWTKACLITSKDANLTKAHVRYLESRLITLAKAAGRANMTNGTEPVPKGLPEPDIADMEFFLEQIEVVLPVVGFDFLRLQPADANETATPDSSKSIKLRLVSSTANANASAIYADGELSVFKGSTATTKQFSSSGYGTLRQQLIDEKQLVMHAAGDALVFAENVTFDSPSAAAAVILNRSSNGRIEWKLDDGRTLALWQDANLSGAPTD